MTVATTAADFLAQARRRLVDGDKYKTPGDMAVDLDPTTVQTPALKLIDRALVDVAEGICDRLMITIPPQEGKSQRVSRRFPTWLLARNPNLRIAIASYEVAMARRWGRVIREDIRNETLYERATNRRLVVAGAAGEWKITGFEGGIVSVGIGSGLTGRPVDVLLIDDPVKDREQADSDRYRARAWDWWTDVGVTRLAPGAPVILIMTRWHEDDLAGRLLAAEDGHRWRVINIPAQADFNVHAGEHDILGRQPGEWLESARGRSVSQWEDTRTAVGAKVFASLYQGKPTAASGDVFLRHWWTRFAERFWSTDGISYRTVDGWRITQSWDMAFKDTASSDFVVGMVWANKGPVVRLLYVLRARLSFTETLDAMRAVTVRWPQASAKLVEDKANGTAVIDSLKREIGGIIAVTPTESKYSRATANSPFIESGSVQLPSRELAADLGFNPDELVEEHAVFPNGQYDDIVDATSQYLSRIFLSEMEAWLAYMRGRRAGLPTADVSEPAGFRVADRAGLRQKSRELDRQRRQQISPHRWPPPLPGWDAECGHCGMKRSVYDAQQKEAG